MAMIKFQKDYSTQCLMAMKVSEGLYTQQCLMAMIEVSEGL